MKCKECNGVGYVKTISVGGVPCSTCNGTYEIEQTNEEWFCQLPTEGKATFLAEKFAETRWEADDIKTPPFTQGLKKIIQATEKLNEKGKYRGVDDDM